jgi:uncharacterized protein
LTPVLRSHVSACLAPPPEELLRAVDEFNRGEWYKCHETLEELWAGAEGEIRHFYQGLLQIAAALHHWRNGNFSGVISLLGKGSGCLRRVHKICQRIEVPMIVATADSFRIALTALGPERMTEIDPSLIPLLHLAPEGREKV